MSTRRDVVFAAKGFCKGGEGLGGDKGGVCRLAFYGRDRRLRDTVAKLCVPRGRRAEFSPPVPSGSGVESSRPRDTARVYAYAIAAISPQSLTEKLTSASENNTVPDGGCGQSRATREYVYLRPYRTTGSSYVSWSFFDPFTLPSPTNPRENPAGLISVCTHCAKIIARSAARPSEWASLYVHL
ncbi:hypothetical protein QTP88_007258 [Uroleucon formosanum]